jgi:branched-chain amino acid transport system substrate-binding protein
MRRKAFLVAGIALLLGLMISADGFSRSKASNPIIIGVVGGFTGFMSPFDTPPYQSMQLAVADVNAKGGVLGRPLKLITADSKSDKVQAGTAAAQLINKGAVFITAPCDFDFGGAAALEAQKHKIVGMSPCAGTVQFGVQGIGPYAYTMGLSAASVMTAFAEWGYQTKKWRTAYVLVDDFILYEKQQAKTFKVRWEQLGGKVLGYDHFQNSDPSIATQIARIKALSKQPDVLVVSSLPPGGVSALRQIRAAGINLPIIGGVGFDGLYWQQGVPGLSNFYGAAYADLQGHDPVPKVNALRKRLVAKFGVKGTQNGSFWLAGYSTIEAFKIAAEKAGTTDGPKLKAALDSFHDVPLLIGPTSFSPNLHIALGRPVRLTQTQNGKLSYLRTWKPQSIPPIASWAKG